MASVVSQQAAGPSVPEAHDAIQAAGVNHSSTCLPQQLHDARLHQGATEVRARGVRDTCLHLSWREAGWAHGPQKDEQEPGLGQTLPEPWVSPQL